MLRMFDFTSAYRQLRPSERIFVDGYINAVERLAMRSNQKLLSALKEMRLDDLDGRSKEILAQGLVQAAIVERVKELSEDAELTVFKTLKELRSMAYSSLGNYMEIDDNGVPAFDLSRCTPEQLAAIKIIKIKERVDKDTGQPVKEFEFILHDKVASIGLLMKYQGLLDEQHWRNEQAKENQQKAISAGQSVDDAADLYARSING